jgi:RsiW-degrading membrane proteinase PrsW (M82 family)
VTQAAASARPASTAQSVRLVRLTAIVLCLFGAGVLIWQFNRFLLVFPGPTALALALEIPLLVVGFVLVRLVRPVRAPALVWSAAAVVWGGTAAAGCALLANRGLIGLWAKGVGIHFAASWSASLSAPLNEEILKLCGVLMVVLAAPLVITGPLDGMVYGALTGLGFQATENVTYSLNNIVLSGATDPASAVANSVYLRVGLTALGSHWTMTAVAGAGVGLLVARGRHDALPAAACLLGAMAMHLLFDAPGLAIIVRVGVNLAAVTGLYLVLRHAYLDRARSLLAGWAAAGVISTEEQTGLLRRRRWAGLARPSSGAERGRLRARHRALVTDLDRAAA